MSPNRLLNGRSTPPVIAAPITSRLVIGVTLGSLLGNIICAAVIVSATWGSAGTAANNSEAAKEEIHRLEMVQAMRDRELTTGAEILVQQRANLEAAQKLGKVLHEGDK